MAILKVDANDSQARFRQKINANFAKLATAVTSAIDGLMLAADKVKFDDACGVNGYLKCDGAGDFSAGADATGDVAGLMPAALFTKLGAISTYTIEEGTSGNWYYKKYSNGTCECWGTYTDTSYAMTTEYAAIGGYYGGQLTATFPFTFAATPRINISTVCPNMGFGLLAAPTTTYTYYRAVNRTSATGTIVSYFHIFGTLA